MKVVLKSILFLFLVFLSNNAFTQEVTQTIRGVVKDLDAGFTLPGVNVVILGSNPALGTATDAEGNFSIENVPIGRHNIQFTFLGYEPKTLSNVVVSSGKEVVLNLEMKEQFIKIKEVKITARSRKHETVNELSMNSAKSFGVEETQRYAGSINDPARLVTAFAGAVGNAAGDNNVIVRGNSPRGVLWRLEGVEIPNPNHFANEGSSGGPISVLNTNMIGQSDFLTGAYTAEYGNALSGVFDLKLRNGNSNKREHYVQVGILGTDIGSEGPFKKGGKATYLFNYRYSTLAMLNTIGINLAGDNTPKYQDGAFKISIPTKKFGNFNIWGLGGFSTIDETTKDEKEITFEKGKYDGFMGVAGISHYYQIKRKGYLKNTISFSFNGSDFHEDKLSPRDEFRPNWDVFFSNQYVRWNSTYQHKFGPRATLKTGVILSALLTDSRLGSFSEERNRFENKLSQKDETDIQQVFSTFNYRIRKNFSIQSGIHLMRFGQTGEIAVEPRLGTRYNLDATRALTFATGLHSKTESLAIYNANVIDDNGHVGQFNKNLKMTRAIHVVGGYEHQLSEKLFFKGEAYYQYLFDVPVKLETDLNTLNLSGGIVDAPLENKGNGRNFGLELTLQKDFSRNYFFLLTSSLYKSEYKNPGRSWKATKYDGNMVHNVMVGKEFPWISKRGRNKTFETTFRLTYAGGNNYTPVNIEMSKQNGYEVLSENRFSEEAEPFFRFDVQLALKTNRKNSTHVLKLDLQNATNYKSVIGQSYNERTQSLESNYQLGLVPSLSYQIQF